MSTKVRFRLATVLRARQAQEDLARGAVVRARVEAGAAADRVRRYEEALDLRGVPEHGSAASHSASLSARQALASALCAAIGVARLAEQTVQERVDDLAATAVQRRSVERLAERQLAERKVTEEAAAQREIDNLTTTAAHRRAGATERSDRGGTERTERRAGNAAGGAGGEGRTP